MGDGMQWEAERPLRCQARALSPDAFDAVRTFFAYDPGIPLNARVVDSTSGSRERRYKIVFSGADGSRVPAYLALPTGPAADPLRRVPVVLTLHAGARSKDDWWRDDGLERGGLVTSRLLAAGIAVLALDAHFHGERSADSDFASFRAMWFERQWFSSIRDGMVRTARDYRRALDCLATRGDIDTTRVGALGYSLGGIMTLFLAAFEPRVRTAVSCVGGLDAPWLFPLAPANLAVGLDRIPVLLLAGRRDPLVTSPMMTALDSAI